MSESLYERTIRLLAGAGIDSPRLEARLLIAHVKASDPDRISSSTTLTENETAKLDDLLAERLNHKPLDKILGHKEFYKYRFKVTEDVLSPRPDTEILVEAAVNLCRKYKLKNILDLGTGSGCILLSIVKDNEQAEGCGVDRSAEALAVAKENAGLLQIEKRCRWLCADWFATDFPQKIGQRYDLIVSNPPYIPTGDIETLAPEVKDHDPRAALDGGSDGFDSYRQIAGLSGGLLEDGGFILLEAGAGQADDLVKLFEKQQLEHVDTVNDFAGIQRCIIFRKKDCN